MAPVTGPVLCGGCERSGEPTTLFSKSGGGRDTCIFNKYPVLFKLAATAVSFDHHPCLEDGPWSMPGQTELGSAVRVESVSRPPDVCLNAQAGVVLYSNSMKVETLLELLERQGLTSGDSCLSSTGCLSSPTHFPLPGTSAVMNTTCNRLHFGIFFFFFSGLLQCVVIKPTRHQDTWSPDVCYF